MSTATAHQNESRERLLEALAESIRERGLQRTQISDIVRIARTSRRTFYECFPDKESCFFELIGAARRIVQAAVLAAVDTSARWDVQVDQAVDAFLGAITRDPALSVTISRELPALGLRGIAVQRKHADEWAQVIVELSASEPMRRAGVGPMSLETAVMVVGGISEIVERGRFRGESPDVAAGAIKAVVKAVYEGQAAMRRSAAGSSKRSSSSASGR